MKWLPFLIFMPLLGNSQIVKITDYNIGSTGLLWSSKVETVESEGKKECFLKFVYRDNGILNLNYSYITYEEVVKISNSFIELGTEALNDEKGREDIYMYYQTSDNSMIGYEVQSKRVNWFIAKKEFGPDSIIRMDREKIIGIFAVAKNKMEELLE